MADTKKTTEPKQDLSEWDRGYRGEVPDETPNSAYTVSGVTGGAETPETVEPGSEGSTKVDPDKA